MEKEIKELGYGKCPDCVWFNDPGGCNVKRDSEICRLNKRLKRRKNKMIYDIMKRRKLIIIPYNIISNLLMTPLISNDEKTLKLETINSGIPEDVKIVSINPDIERRGFIFEICHKSFSLIEDGVKAPELIITHKMIQCNNLNIVKN